MTDRDLLVLTKKFVREEKKLIAKIINQLDLIEQRKLYCDLKYESLFEYCVKELGYSEDQAWRRISAVRLARKVPKVKEEIEKGELSLTNANLVSGFFKDVSLTAPEQNELVKEISGKSKRECQDKLNELRQQRGIEKPKKRTIIKNENSETVRVHLNLKKSTYKKLEQLKGIYAHQKKDLSELIDLMADHLIEEKTKEVQPRQQRSLNTSSRSIRPSLRAELLKEADHKCSNCASTYALQIDHITPIALGGKTIKENLRVLCRNCNLRVGIKVFGGKLMKRMTHVDNNPLQESYFELSKGNERSC